MLILNRRRSPLSRISASAALGLMVSLSLAACGDSSDSGDGSGSDASGFGTGSGDGSAGESGFGGTSGGWDPSGGATGTSGAGTTGGGPDEEPPPEEEPPEEEPPEEMKCDDETPVVLYLSPDDSNSMSSPVQAREAVLGTFGSLSNVPVRTYEFMNYYTFQYPTPEAGKLTLTTELLKVAETTDRSEFVLQIGVASETVTNEDRAPLNITLVLDESGSMSGTPMEMQKESCRAIAASLKSGDIVSAVGWDTTNAIKLGGYAVTGPDDSQLLAVCNGLEAGGGTDLAGGLKAGYQLAEASYDAGRINRIVLISDGGANVGITNEEIIAEHAGANNEDGIYMVGVGVGDATSYNDLLMDTVTDIGKGASVFIPNAEEAWKIFNTQFVNTLAVSARDVQVELELPPGFSIVKFSGEEYSTDPAEVEPQHLAPNDAMVFYQQIETCAPSLISPDTPVSVTVRYKDGVTFEERTVADSISFGDLMGDSSLNLLKGRAVYTYAEALKAQSDFEVDPAVAVAEAFEALEAAEAALPEDAELAEIRAVLEAL